MTDRAALHRALVDNLGSDEPRMPRQLRVALLVPRLVTLDLRSTGLTEVAPLGTSDRLGLLDVRDNQLSPVPCAQLAKAFSSALVSS